MRTRRCVLPTLIGALLGACGGADTGDGAADGLALADCVGGGIADAKCGSLSVEENRAAPNGRTIDLAILVAPATSRTPAADPVFLLAGGPGQGAAELGPQIVHKFDAIRRDRAMVFVDLRGTGSAGPLDCDAEDPEDLGELLAASFAFDQIDACLTGYGVTDLTQYTTPAMVEDLDAVRSALGYEQINLLGISYGSRLALEYMREHGEHIRSAVLDGVVPADVGVSLAAPANAEAALDLLIRDCSEDPGCAAAFPGLARKLEQVLVDLGSNRKLEELEHPRTGERIRVDITRAGFVSVLRTALYSGYYTSLVPVLIDRAHAGDYGPIAAVGLHAAAGISTTVSMGLYFAVACSEDLREVEPEARRAAIAGLEVFDDHMLAQLERVCARWPHAELDARGFAPVSSSVPTLMLSGRYDPVTPPALAEHAAATLSQVRHVIAGNLSHGVWHQGCAPNLLAEFFVDPDPAALDASCIDAVPRPRMFLGPNGPRRSVAHPTEFPAPSNPNEAGAHPGPAIELAQGEGR